MPSKITIRDRRIIKAVKNLLEEQNLLSKRTKITSEDGLFYIYSLASPQESKLVLKNFSGDIQIEPFEEKDTLRSFESIVRRYLENSQAGGVDLDVPLLMSKVPQKWSIYPPMVLFGTGGFDSKLWTEAFSTSINASNFFTAVRSAFPATITHFAINKPIVEEDVMRRPFNLVPLHGDFGPDPTNELYESPDFNDLKDAFWCHVVQNSIYQTWAPRYTMFSRGNIKEKKRVLDTFKNLQGLVVMDFYAGIGYFTFSYLANGALLLCWELNPWSIEGLVKGLAENGYKYKVITGAGHLTKAQFDELVVTGVRAFVFHESNENVIPRLEHIGRLPISHINLGLLPSLQKSWGTVKSVRDKWTTKNIVAHVHENEHNDRLGELQDKIAQYYGADGKVLHLEKVKTFAPDIWHVVVDIDVGGAT